MNSISSLYGTFRKVPKIEDYAEMPPQIGAAMMLNKMDVIKKIPASINIAASFFLWWRCRQRTVWRILPETADYIRTVNLSFLPEKSPPSWKGDCLVIESSNYDEPFLYDIFSLACYRIKDMKGKERYFFVYVKKPDGCSVFSISADLYKINRKMAESGELFENSFLIEKEEGLSLQGDVPERMKEQTFDIIRFVFAFSYYLEAPGRIRVERSEGPILRNKKGKPVKRKGKVQPVWSYANVAIRVQGLEKGEGKPLEKDNLALEPVIVSPYIRRHGSKVVIVDQHDSHRWKKKEVPLGTKKTI